MTIQDFEFRPLPPGIGNVFDRMMPTKADSGSPMMFQREVLKVREYRENLTDGTVIGIRAAVGIRDGVPPMIYLGDARVFRGPSREALECLEDQIHHLRKSDVHKTSTFRETSRIIALMCSSKAKERNRGRRLAKKMGWLTP